MCRHSGVGTPQDLLAAVAHGVDMFDCVLPTRSGRNGQAFTWDGPINIRNAKFAEDQAVVGGTSPGVSKALDAFGAEYLELTTPVASPESRRALETVAGLGLNAKILTHTRANPNAAFAGSVPYLMLAGNLVAGWQMARALLIAEDRLAAGEDVAFMQAKITTARFYADHILARAPGVRDAIVEGADSVTDLALDLF